MRKSRILLAMHFLFKGNIFTCKSRIGRVKDILYGKKKYHLVEPSYDWSETIDHKMRAVKYRKVYCWYGRIRSPFRRSHHKGIEFEDGTILKYERIEQYLNDIRYKDYAECDGTCIGQACCNA